MGSRERWSLRLPTIAASSRRSRRRGRSRCEPAEGSAGCRRTPSAEKLAMGQVSPLAFRNGCGDGRRRTSCRRSRPCSSRGSPGSVSFAETALTSSRSSSRLPARRDVLTIGATFWKPVMCFGSARTVYFDGVRRAAGRSRRRPRRAPCPSRAPRTAEMLASGANVAFVEAVLLRVADEARVARLALGEAAELERADLLQVGDRLQPVLLRRRVRHREHVGVVERRRVQDRVALRRLELLRERVGRRCGLRRVRLVEDDLHDHARVLGIEVDLPAREGGLDHLGRADVLLVETLKPFASSACL